MYTIVTIILCEEAIRASAYALIYSYIIVAMILCVV